MLEIFGGQYLDEIVLEVIHAHRRLRHVRRKAGAPERKKNFLDQLLPRAELDQLLPYAELNQLLPRAELD
jgi:hypothetical protein